MSDVKFRLKLEKTDQQGKAPVILDYHYQTFRFRFATKEKCTPKHWDADKMRFRKSFPGYQDANDYLDSLVERLKKAYREYMGKGIVPSPSMLKSELLPEQQKQKKAEPVEPDMLELFERFIDVQKKRGLKDSTAKCYRTGLSRMRRYVEQGGKLSISRYTNQVHQDFVDTMITRFDLNPNSVVDTCKHLVVFFRYCQDELGLKLHPQHAKIKAGFIEADRMFLLEEDLLKLKKAKLTDSLARVRDAFLFACYTGLRHSDLSRLSYDHVVERGEYLVLSFLPEKTTSARQKQVKRVEVPLLPEALEIMHQYEGQQATIIPILTNQKMNEYLKVVGMRAELDDLVELVEFEKGHTVLTMKPKYECLTMHIARHTYATLSLMKGVPLPVLQKALGHSDIKTTMLYAKVIDEFKYRSIVNAWQK